MPYHIPYISLKLTFLNLQVFKEIGLTRFHIIGESLGSAYAGQFASLYPDMIDSIITLCPPGKATTITFKEYRQLVCLQTL